MSTDPSVASVAATPVYRDGPRRWWQRLEQLRTENHEANGPPTCPAAGASAEERVAYRLAYAAVDERRAIHYAREAGLIGLMLEHHVRRDARPARDPSWQLHLWVLTEARHALREQARGRRRSAQEWRKLAGEVQR